MTIGTTLVIVFFALLWGWLIYEMHIAPELDDDGNIKIDITEEDLDKEVISGINRRYLKGVLKKFMTNPHLGFTFEKDFPKFILYVF